ncbi:MAG: methylenetetrahydrofolate reductase [NAD(P)H] [Gammaproteobacteria bacterium]
MSRTALSFEFFPPKSDEGAARLATVRDELARLDPEYFSVTYGAGGSTRDRTLQAVFAIQAAGLQAAPHISCIGATRDSIRELLRLYRERGIHRLVALRGDIPSGMATPGEFRYANELVAFIREETGEHFFIEVAAYPEFHPEAPSAEKDLANFARKVAAGANGAITQYFFNPDAYFRFVDDVTKRGVDIPIVPGIMPITNSSQLIRFSEMCGAEIPRWIRKRLEGFGDDREAIRAFGLDVVTELCRRLLEGGAPGLHFYTMNQSPPTLSICRAIGLA